ncbi:MAG: RidA family protein [Burkholderiaceae bacterium]
MATIEQKLTALNLTIPEAAAPLGNYVGYTVSGNTVYVSGQLPLQDGAVAVTGKVGADVTVEQGYEAGRICAINLIAQLRAACGGDLNRVVKVLRLGGFVNVAPDFVDAPKCINGASDLFVELFGDKGRHARFAVGVATLPAGAAVEIDGTFEIA